MNGKLGVRIDRCEEEILPSFFAAKALALLRAFRDRAADPAARVVMLTTSDVEEDVFRAIEDGALGYVMKESPVETIGAAIRSAMAGDVYMTDEVRRIYEARKSAKGLSARECEVLARAGRGENNREIAAAMELSENTVKMFMKRAFFKLGATSRAEAVRLAGRRGLIPEQ